MARRGENIRKRKDGRWEGRYINIYGIDGKAKYKSIYAQSYSDCKHKLSEAKAASRPLAMQKSNYADNVKTSEVFRDWLESIRVSVKHSTYVKYRNIVLNHILPEFGGTRLSTLSNKHINQFLFNKLDSGRLDGKGGLSVSSVHTMYVIIISAFKFAADNGFMFGAVIKFKPPQKLTSEICVLDKEEQLRFEKALLDNFNCSKLGVFLCLYTGLRLGEVCSLKWEDIDRVRRVVKVRNTVQRIQTFQEEKEHKTKLIAGSPKSRASIRDVPIPTCLMDLLDAFFPIPKSGYILSGSETFLDPRTYQYRFKGYLKNAGISDIHFHALRSTYATNCIVAGIDTKSLSQMMGHANVNITLNKYVNASDNMKQIQVDKLSGNRGRDWGIKPLLTA